MQFPKGWFWQMFPRNENRNEGAFTCFPGTKTRTRVHSPKPPFYETALLSPSELSPNLKQESAKRETADLRSFEVGGQRGLAQGDPSCAEIQTSFLCPFFRFSMPLLGEMEHNSGDQFSLHFGTRSSPTPSRQPLFRNL